MPGKDAGGDVPDPLGVEEVGDDSDDADAWTPPPNRLGGGVETPCVPVDEDEVGASPCQLVGQLLTHAACGTGDDCGAARELERPEAAHDATSAERRS